MAGSPTQEGKLYSSRHEHMVFLYEGLPRYTCSGCKQFGANVGFKCHSCPNFILHEACATIPDEYVHPLLRQKPLKFRKRTKLRHHCDGCGETVRGFVFESHSPHLKLHPLCTALPRILTYSGHTNHGDMRLVIEKDGNYNCSQCTKVNANWKYRCAATACKVKVDLNCAIVDFNRLSENGIARVSRSSGGKDILQKLSRWSISVVKTTAGYAFYGFVEGVAYALGVKVIAEAEDDDQEAKSEAETEDE